jgi:hypothetical protein
MTLERLNITISIPGEAVTPELQGVLLRTALAGSIEGDISASPGEASWHTRGAGQRNERAVGARFEMRAVQELRRSSWQYQAAAVINPNLYPIPCCL